MTTAQASPPSAASRRGRSSAASVALCLLATAICAGLIFLAETRRVRADLTASGEHTLSQRTRIILAALDEPCSIVAVAEQSRLDPTSRRLLADLLDAFSRASPRVNATLIDPAAPDGSARFEAFIASLAASRAEAVAAHRAALSGAMDALASLAPLTAAAGESADRARPLLAPVDPARETLGQRGATLRVRGADLQRLAGSAREQATVRVGAADLPASDRLREPLRAALAGVARELDAASLALAQARAADAANQPSLAEAARECAALRDRALAAAEPLLRLAPLDVLAVARALEARSAVVASTASRIVAAPLERLFVGSAAAPGDPASALRFRGEETIADAIAAVAPGPRPIVCLVHAVAAPLLDDAGEPASADAQAFFARLIERLRSRGIDVMEWPVTTRPERPTAASLPSAPAGDSPSQRPIVWVVVPVAASTPRSNDVTSRLGAATKSLIDAGENLLVTLEPSPFPRVGEPDPLAAALEPFGILPDTARPLMRRISTPRGPIVWPESKAVADAPGPDAPPLARAIAGLATFVPWPTPLNIAPNTPAHITPLLRIPASSDTWGESQWLAYRALSREQRAAVAPADQPSPDPARDSLQGPWLIAAASERPRENAPPQRAVIVGASAWFMDPVIEETETIDGRQISANPGNAELFENSIHWLARRDDLIAPGARALQTPRIRALGPGPLAAIRWAAALGPPLIVLLIGAAYRILRD